MNREIFEEVLQGRISNIEKVLKSKRGEYATDVDVLHNFKRAGAKSESSPEKALMGFKLKHEISMEDIINNLDKGVLPTVEILEEKIGDIINYWILLEALIKERISNK